MMQRERLNRRSSYADVREQVKQAALSGPNAAEWARQALQLWQDSAPVRLQFDRSSRRRAVLNMRALNSVLRELSQTSNL